MLSTAPTIRHWEDGATWHFLRAGIPTVGIGAGRWAWGTTSERVAVADMVKTAKAVALSRLVSCQPEEDCWQETSK